jgi:hypothetical protein
MPLMQVSRPLARKSAILAMAAALCLGGCTVGPDYHKPTAVAPADWTSWHSGSDALRPALADAAPLPPDWWQGFRSRSRRTRTARLCREPRLAHRRAPFRAGTGPARRDRLARPAASQCDRAIQGQRQSEYGASTRLFDEIGGANRDALAKLLGEPYTLYKGGFDASWEIDFWGKVRRSVEAANADIAQQGALLDQARLLSPATWRRPISRCAAPSATLPWPARTSTTCANAPGFWPNGRRADWRTTSISNASISTCAPRKRIARA